MKNLFLTTAVASLFAVPALAQDTMFRADATDGAVHASELIGARVYASTTLIEADAYNGVQQDWEDIGEINDVIVSRDGQVESVLVDIGGFLGMGERQTAVDMTALRFVYDDATADNPDDWFVVMNADRAMIEGAPEWSMTARMPADTADAPMTGDAPMTDDTPMATDAPMATAPANTDMVANDAAMAREGYDMVPATEVTTETLTGVNVYDATDSDIGEVSDIVVSTDGKVDGIIIDVGGFLGLGAKPVMLGLSDLTILRKTDDANDLRIYVSSTKEALEAMPEYAE